MISPTQRPLPDNTQHSQETVIRAPDGIRTHIPSKRADTHPRLRTEDTASGSPEYVVFYCEYNCVSFCEISMTFLLSSCLRHTLCLIPFQCVHVHAPQRDFPIYLSQFYCCCCCLLSFSIHLPLYEVGSY